ncbi:MAG: hypothetical protein Q9160_004684 [Pyrenula sp. 1 TL-2023]
MATVLPQIPPPPVEPPSSPLPALPKSKTRKSLPVPAETAKKTPSNSQTPSKLRAPSASPRPSALPTPQTSSSTPLIPTVRSTSSPDRKGDNGPDKTVRKVISIASFPQPPSALVSPTSRPTTASGLNTVASTRKRPSDALASTYSGSSAGSIRAPKSGLARSGSYRGPQVPSLLNGSGDGKSVTSAQGHRASESQLSVSSPPQSRTSSAQGSYSTSATTFEDTDEAHRGHDDIETMTSESRQASKRKESKGNVLVSVRVRPDAPGNENARNAGEWMVDGRNSLVSHRGKEGGDYIYGETRDLGVIQIEADQLLFVDNVFVAHDNNAKVYDASAKRLVRRVMEGFHGTVFAYGMTGTGKTFSMQGTATNPGVIPLAITDIFSFIRETPHREFLLRVSYLEIYNEKIHDLLSPPSDNSPIGTSSPPEEIKLREDSKRGVYATPLKEEIVQSPTQLLRVIARGDHARRTSSTQYNARSSRSHAVVQIVVESRERAATNGSLNEGKRAAMLPGGVRVSTLSLIDLAGSERAAENKERRTEGAHINKSLLTLGTVIARLSGNKDKSGGSTDKDGKHLPYRDSKLTRLLQGALSGNSLVSILCTIQLGSQGSSAAAHSHTGETLNTLKFAARAKNNIVSHAKRQEEAIGAAGANSGLLERYRAEIQTLRSQLDNQQKAQVEREERRLEKEAEQRHEEQMLEMQLARTALKERIEHLNRLILCSKSTGVNSSAGTASALGMHGRLSGGTINEGASRSLRSSASQSTLGANSRTLNRNPSIASFRDPPHARTSLGPNVEEDEEGLGDFGDGSASLQAQNRALQADLQDKNRYISTLEKRLLQARRSSHSRTSMGLSNSHKPNASLDENDMSTLIKQQETDISSLRAQLEDKDRMLTALRSAARKRDVAELTPDTSSAEFPQESNHRSQGSKDSASTSRGSQIISPVAIISPQKAMDTKKKRRSVDEVSRMLDEMIQEKVGNGDLVRGKSGSVRMVSSGSKNETVSESKLPPLGTLVSALRGSVVAGPSA